MKTIEFSQAEQDASVIKAMFNNPITDSTFSFGYESIKVYFGYEFGSPIYHFEIYGTKYIVESITLEETEASHDHVKNFIFDELYIFGGKALEILP